MRAVPRPVGADVGHYGWWEIRAERRTTVDPGIEAAAATQPAVSGGPASASCGEPR